MLKPLAKGASDRPMHLKPTVPCITRLGSLAAANSKPISEEKEAPLKDWQIKPIAEGVTDVASPSMHRDFSTLITTLQPIVEALNKILDGNGLTVDTIKGIFKYIKEVEAAERGNKDRMEMQAEVSSFCKAFKDSIQQV
jgi:hypothetical protein